jgi:hypothetical protein
MANWELINASKAVVIPHISLIANVIMMATHNKVNDDSTSWNNKTFRPGDIGIAGKHEYTWKSASSSLYAQFFPSFVSNLILLHVRCMT